MGRTLYYYVRDNGKPVVTVCLLRTGNLLSRGVAICSDKDNPCKKTGRDIAKGRAEQAVFYGTTCGCIQRTSVDKVLQLMEKNGLGTFYKAVFDPFLTDLERKLLEVQPVVDGRIPVYPQQCDTCE